MSARNLRFFTLFTLIHFLYLSTYNRHTNIAPTLLFIIQFCPAEHRMNGSADPKDVVIEPDGPSEVFRDDEEPKVRCLLSNRKYATNV